MKKLLLFSIAPLFIIGEAAAQLPSLTVTITNATNCSPPCNGSAAATNVPGATYVWNTTPVQTTSTAIGLCAGTYSVTATLAPFGSSSGSGTVICSTGILEYALSNQIEIFPNPATKDISIALFSPNGGMVSEVSVFNIAGEKVVSKTFTSSKKFSNSLYVGNLPSGTYFLELKDEKNTYRTKLIKQ